MLFQHVLVTSVWHHTFQPIPLKGRGVGVAEFDFRVWVGGGVWFHLAWLRWSRSLSIRTSIARLVFSVLVDRNLR